MALKTSADLSKTSSPETASHPSDTILLELALYTNYTWQGETYEKGKAYRFKRNDAIKLLSERDHERPLWKTFHPVKPKIKVVEIPAETQIIDMTEQEPIHGLPVDEPGKRIDVGSDDEIQDIIGKIEDGEGNVLV